MNSAPIDRLDQHESSAADAQIGASLIATKSLAVVALERHSPARWIALRARP
jgi:hypothetical protein